MMVQAMRLQLATARMLAEAQMVIGLRMLGMAGVLPAAPGEDVRMVVEKQSAFAQAWTAAWRSPMLGRGPVATGRAALVPVGRATRANARRLTKGAAR